MERQHQQLHYEAQRAFDQFDRIDPANRLVADVLEQRWNTKLEALKAVQVELAALAIPLSRFSDAERKAILGLGENFAVVWGDPACPMTLKKKIARTLINEVVVDLDDATQQLRLIILGVYMNVKPYGSNGADQCKRRGL